SPRPPEERNSKNVDTIIESPSPSPIPVENDDYDSEGDIRFLEELFINDPLPLPEIESSNLDHFNDPSSPRPPPEPPDVEISLIFEPNAPVINNVDELNEDECFDPGEVRLMLKLTIVSPLPSSTKNEDTIFDPGIST
ncbi:hypothetical protein Tco_0437063, partial [Tanacetum coccineum]